MYESMTSGANPVTPSKLSRVQSKGQVTIPTEIRKKLGLKKDDLVAFVETEDGVLLSPRELFVASAAHTDELLQHQWPHLAEPNPIQLSPAAFERIVLTAMAKSQHAMQTIPTDTIMERMQARRALLQEMKTWLDQQPNPLQ
jgi:AbrB family looped-hinge helix DNA binding protein